MKITLTCEVCLKPMKGDDAYLCVDWLKAMKSADAWENFSRERGEIVSGTDMWDLHQKHPEVKWHAYHRACDPEPDNNDYWIGADRLTTLTELLDWNQHLNEKNWVRHTDWNAMVAGSSRASTRISIKESK